MSTEPLLYLNKAITLDLGASGSSAILDLSSVSAYAVHEIYTGTAPTGTINVEGSNDGINFQSVDANAITAAGQKMVEKSSAQYVYLRISYTRTSGTGSLTAYVSAKRSS